MHRWWMNEWMNGHNHPWSEFVLYDRDKGTEHGNRDYLIHSNVF